MAEILKGKDVVDAMKAKMTADVEALKSKGVEPTLAIVRVGERGDDISYEKGAMTRCKGIGVTVKNFVLPADATQDDLLKVIDEVNKDKGIHGCLLFRPLPKHINENYVRNQLAPEKDVDGITDLSMAGTYACTDLGFPPLHTHSLHGDTGSLPNRPDRQKGCYSRKKPCCGQARSYYGFAEKRNSHCLPHKDQGYGLCRQRS